MFSFFFFQAEDGIRDGHVTGVQTCALPISPVTTTLRMMPRELAGFGYVKRRDEADHGRHLVLGETGTAALHDLALERRGALAGTVLVRAQQHVGDHDLAGDRIPPRAHQRHPHVRMPVDHRLDLLGMDLEAANIDDAVAPADEMITLAAQLYHV